MLGALFEEQGVCIVHISKGTRLLSVRHECVHVSA